MSSSEATLARKSAGGTQEVTASNARRIRAQLLSRAGALDLQSGRWELGAALWNSFRTHGVAWISCPPALRTLIRPAYESFIAFSSLPLARREAHFRPEIGGARGFIWRGRSVPAILDGEIALDAQEAWHTGRDLNRFPSEVPTFGKCQRELFNGLENIGLHLVESLGNFISDSGYLASLVLNPDGARSGDHLLRTIRYPPGNAALVSSVCANTDLVLRHCAHEDLSLLTILPPATSEGLALHDEEGWWHPKMEDEASLLVVPGNMLRLILAESSVAIRASIHAVFGTPSTMVNDRYSAGMFITPRCGAPLVNLAADEIIAVEGQRIDEAGVLLYQFLRARGRTDSRDYAEFKAQYLAHGEFRLESRPIVLTEYQGEDQ